MPAVVADQRLLMAERGVGPEIGSTHRVCRLEYGSAHDIARPDCDRARYIGTDQGADGRQRDIQHLRFAIYAAKQLDCLAKLAGQLRRAATHLASSTIQVSTIDVGRRDDDTPIDASQAL